MACPSQGTSLCPRRTNSDSELIECKTLIIMVDLVLQGSKESVGPIRGRERILTPLVGETTSNLHRIRDDNDRRRHVAVFPDLSVRLEGEYCLMFHVYEIFDGACIHQKSINSNTFRVYPAKEFPGMAETTPLTMLLKQHAIRVKTSKSVRGRDKFINSVVSDFHNTANC